MTVALSGEEIAGKLEIQFAGSIVEATQDYLVIKGESLLDMASFLKTTPGLEFDYLTYVTATDYVDYFEVVYQLTSLKHNHGTILKVRCHDRENPTVPSVVSLWRGADLQEREIHDLLGISFKGHPNLKPLLLWDGFKGYPLRKDYK
ncbi:NADH-quinone oxidoreductase subunit C [Chloroflexota bacterium]